MKRDIAHEDDENPTVLKKPTHDDEDDEEEEEEEVCRRFSHGACDCKKCMTLIILNARLLFVHGFIVNWCDNGAGGYGFDVHHVSEMQEYIGCPKGAGRGICDYDKSGVCNCERTDMYSISPFTTNAELRRIAKDVVPSAWTGYCNNGDMVKSWRKFFHLLKDVKNN